MLYASPVQMKIMESYSDSHGISYKQLMENAGVAAAEQIYRLAAERDMSNGVLILCGKGNNGGDGFVAARNLINAGIKVTVVLTEGEPCTELAAYEYCELGGSADVLTLEDNIDEVFRLLSSCSLIVDSVYGTGFHGDLPPQIKACFNAAARSEAIKLAMDVPSGGNCVTGEASDDVLKCDYTVTFACRKTGMLFEPLKSLCGKIITAEIGFTDECFSAADYILRDFDESQIRNMFPERPENSYKNMFGRLLDIAGSRTMSGAAYLSAAAALRSGAGLVTIASTEDVIGRISASVPEATLLPMKSDKSGTVSEVNISSILKFAEKCTAVSAGCGLSVTDGTKAVIKSLAENINNAEYTLILDADGLNCLTDCIDIIRNTTGRLILTPHEGELKRLYKAAYGDKKADRLSMAIDLSREYNAVIVAKGVPTFIVGNGKAYICKTGNPGLSRGGSGDVLTGIIAGFACQGLAPLDAAMAGVFVHGTAADIAAQELSILGMLPTDVIIRLPYVFKKWNR